MAGHVTYLRDTTQEILLDDGDPNLETENSCKLDGTLTGPYRQEKRTYSRYGTLQFTFSRLSRMPSS